MEDFNYDDSNGNEDTDELTTAAEVIQKIEEVWVNEKFAPDLLQYEGELVECLLDQIQHMENSLQRIEKEDFRMVFHKMELDRIKYILSSYLRTRIEKIEKFGAHLLHLESQDQESANLMSDEERVFAYKFTTSIKTYLNDVALKHMPSNLKALEFEEISCKPQMDRFVFVKVKKACQGVVLESYTDYGEEEIIDLNEGSRHFLRYKPIAPMITDGSVQLI